MIGNPRPRCTPPRVAPVPAVAHGQADLALRVLGLEVESGRTGRVRVLDGVRAGLLAGDRDVVGLVGVGAVALRASGAGGGARRRAPRARPASSSAGGRRAAADGRRTRPRRRWARRRAGRRPAGDRTARRRSPGASARRRSRSRPGVERLPAHLDGAVGEEHEARVLGQLEALLAIAGAARDAERDVAVDRQVGRAPVRADQQRRAGARRSRRSPCAPPAPGRRSRAWSSSPR